jgi:transposase
VDQPNNIGSLTLSCARATGCDVAYLPGLAMRRAAGLFPGEAKTDERDAYIICMTARALPESLRPVPAPDEVRCQLLALAAYDDDCRCDRTREISRMRAHLIEDHPHFEHLMGNDLAKPFILKALAHYGGPWGMVKAGRGNVRRWAANQKNVAAKLVERMCDAAYSMKDKPAGADMREAYAIPACAKRIAALDAQRKAIDDKVSELMAVNKVYQALLTMPGVGAKTALALVLHVDITAFSNADKLASYAGLAPRTHQSGTSIKGESAARIGNRALKSALFLSAFAAVRTDKYARDYYDTKRSEGKHHNAAVISLARKRLKVMYAIMRTGESYRACA